MLYNVAGLVTTVQTTDGPAPTVATDSIHGNDGNDLILGGVDIDTIWGDEGNDIVLGDDGVMALGTSGPTCASCSPSTTPTGRSAATDTIRGGGGDDLLIGGPGNDAIDGGTERDLIFGDNVPLDRTTHLGNFTSPRFRTLCRRRRSTAPRRPRRAGPVDGTPRLDPHGNPAWGDFVITLLDHGTNHARPARFGNDYIAGGAGDDMIFGRARQRHDPGRRLDRLRLRRRPHVRRSARRVDGSRAATRALLDQRRRSTPAPTATTTSRAAAATTSSSATRARTTSSAAAPTCSA